MKTIITALMTVAALGCDSDAKPSSNEKPAAQPTRSGKAEETPGGLSTEARTGIGIALGDYEDIRAKLAQDDLESVSGAALKKSAESVAVKAPEALRDHLAALADAAGKLEEAPKGDADAVRKAFGEVSRSAIALLTAEESLRKDLHVFECPMAQGYKKWVQPSETKENPYMGQKMLQCGSASTWTE